MNAPISLTMDIWGECVVILQEGTIYTAEKNKALRGGGGGGGRGGVEIRGEGGVDRMNVDDDNR
jgi:hypothetical protein